MIRPVGGTDVTAIAALQVRAWQENYGHFVDEAHMPVVGDREALLQDLLPGQAWLAERDGQIAGVIGLADGEVKVLYVDPPHQGRGVGSALLAHAEAQLRAGGHVRATLWAFRDNVDGRAFYERRGWVRVGEPLGVGEWRAPGYRYEREL